MCAAAVAVALALACTSAVASARAGHTAAVTFSANGSVEQVYVTGLGPGERMSLLDRSGRTVATQPADSLGGLLFRNLAPGTGYRVRVYPRGAESGPITVHSGAAAPWDPDIYNQSIPNNGYDVIETIAHQPWVLDHKVGMMGISYGAISQLFTAQLDPPDLEAISPLSTIDTTATTLYPGGILNTGFAVAWAKQRQQEAEPAGPNAGQPYAYQQIQQGDQTCKANQVLHGEAANLLAKIRANSHYIPKVADPLDPITFVNKIKVPVFMACQWEDEQTGGHCADLMEHFTGTRQKWFTFTNGAHVDSLDPYTYDRWYDFLELFVAHQAPFVNQAAVHTAAPVVYQSALGLPANDLVALPPDPIQQDPNYQSALSVFEALPSVRVLFDNGAGTSPAGSMTPGDPYPGFEQSFSKFPIPGTTARSWYLGPNGALGDTPPAHKGINWYTSNAKALPLNDYGSNNSSGGLWGNASEWQYN